MMLHSAAADMPRGLRKPFPGHGNALGRGRAGIGELSPAEVTAALASGAGPGSPAYEQYYGAGGTYQRAASVIAAYGDANADHIADVSYNPVTRTWVDTSPGSDQPPGESGPVELYAMENCLGGSADCVAANGQRQLANLRAIENARLAFNLQVCQYNDSLNPGAQSCTQYALLPVIPATGSKVLVTASGGSYSTPMAGETAAQLQARTQAWIAQQTAPASTNQPNQSAPPRPQPGEVPTGGGITAAELAAILAAQNKQASPGFSLVDADGKILGLDPMMLALIAAGVGALMLLKK